MTLYTRDSAGWWTVGPRMETLGPSATLADAGRARLAALVAYYQGCYPAERLAKIVADEVARAGGSS